ncbi:MAG: hypothetical protein N2114_00425 [Candidatus Goldbacteria bacterium]|nr:hypothetical protein [Candidatus Goldiibacteriota bacterium]
MKIRLFIILLFFISCHHIQDTKYEVLYNKNLTEEINKAKVKQGVENYTPLFSEIKKEDIKKSTDAKKDKKKKVKIKEVIIKSDSMNFERETSKAVFEKNVKVIAEDVVLYADTLESNDYKKEAYAEGNIIVNYKKGNVKLTSKKIRYVDNFNKVIANGDIKVDKILEDGNTLTMFADEVEFDIENEKLLASKKKKRIKVKMKNLIAFADKISYDDKSKELFMEGKPVVKKQSSFFLSEVIIFNTDKKTIKLKGNIWSKLFYNEFEKTSKEIEKSQKKLDNKQ